MRRLISSSGCSWNGGGAWPAVSSRLSVTSAMLREARAMEPAKITSSISPPRMERALFSPIAQRSASTTLDLPQPFGPTTPVRPGRISTVAGSAKLLNPAMRRREKLTGKRNSRLSGGGGDQLLERGEVQRAGLLLAVDDEGRGRVDLPLFLRRVLLLEDEGLEGRVVDRRIEGLAAHAGQRRHLPQLVGAVDAFGESPAVLACEQRADEGLVALRRQGAGDHRGGQRHLVEREVAEHVADFAGVDQLGLHLGHRCLGEVGAVGAGEGEILLHG